MNSIQVLELRNPPRHRPPCAYVVDDFHRPEVRELRERYRLDEKVTGAKDRFDALIRLSNWLGGLNQFGVPPERVPMNAFDIIEAIQKKGHHFECSYMPHAFSQIAHAMGYPTRLVWMGWNGEEREGGAHHQATEVWVDGLDKWVLVDALHRLHYERDGMPLSLLEVRRAGYENEHAGVHILIGPDRWTIPFDPDTSPAKGDEVLQRVKEGKLRSPIPCAGMYFWCAALMQNAYFANLHHNSESYYRVLVWRDRHNADKVWFQRCHEDRSVRFIHWIYWGAEKIDVWSPHRWEFPVNQVHVDWQQKADETLELAFETTCPNFAHFEIVIDGNNATRHKHPWFTWRLHPGENTFRVRTENLFGVRGTASELKISL